MKNTIGNFGHSRDVIRKTTPRENRPDLRPTGEDQDKVKVIDYSFQNINSNQKERGFMKSFPDFMKSELNKIDQSQQNTKDIVGYYYTGKDGSQIAF